MAPIDLYHETGIRFATRIARDQRIASITSPYPAEFLPRTDHANFRNMGGFKGRGVVLSFQWIGPVEDFVDGVGQDPQPGVLYRVYTQGAPVMESGKPDPIRWSGNRGCYWCHRLYKADKADKADKAEAGSLVLKGFAVRPPPMSCNNDAIVHVDEPSEKRLATLRDLIGPTGIEMVVDGNPPPDLPAVSFDAVADNCSRLFRLFRRRECGG